MFPMQPYMWSAFTHGMPFGYPHPAFMPLKQEPSEAVPSEAEAQKSLKRKRIPEGQPCLICEEPATGYNYGVASCNGCKTFFRRSMLGRDTFICLKGGNCDVTESMRNGCRKCRLDKCMRFGMDASALGGERDKRSNIIKMPVVMKEELSPPPVARRLDETKQLVEHLTHIEMQCNELRSKDLGECGTLAGVLSQPSWLFRLNDLADDTPAQFTELRPATMEDVQAWNIREMRLCVEWAKALDCFQSLAKTDKICLVKGFAMSFNILNRVFYSEGDDSDKIVYPSGAFVSREPQESLCIPACKWAFGRQIDELMLPLRELEIGLTEFALFKALLFFNPDVLGLNSQAKLAVKNVRQQFVAALFRTLTSKHGLAVGSERYTALLLRAASLQSIVSQVEGNMHLMDVFDHFWPINGFVKEACL
ncbi:CBN-NHR-1 protein [Aphelenchoides avenae]|nr:CBN-NHR-1 protein [Aphelenchus avenae]